VSSFITQGNNGDEFETGSVYLVLSTGIEITRCESITKSNNQKKPRK